jgi:hypothetical protein
MYLVLILLSMLAFLALCLVGLVTLIKQAIADPPSSAPPTYAARTSAAPSEDAEGSACGESCA